MFITGDCNKCGGKVVLDIENLKKEQVEDLFKKIEFGHCAVGFHVEMGKMADYYSIDWTNSFDSSSEAKAYNKKKEYVEFEAKILQEAN